MLSALMKYQFLQNAVWAGLLASIVCGVNGVIIVEKKLIMMSGGIAHTAYGGVGLGCLLGFEPIWGAMLISILAALGIGVIKRRADTLRCGHWSFLVLKYGYRYLIYCHDTGLSAEFKLLLIWKHFICNPWWPDFYGCAYFYHSDFI